MRTPFRCHVRRDGSPKRKFATQQEAAEFVARQGGHEYQCPLCSSWHIASNPTARRSR